MVSTPLAASTAVVQVGADVAFFTVFGLFVVAFVVLSVITVRWAIRRDRSGHDEWLEGRQVVPPTGNGLGSAESRGRTPGAPR